MSSTTSAGQKVENDNWHAMPVADVVDSLGTDSEQGLGDHDVQQRREQFGENRLTPQASRTALRRLLDQANNLFIYLLLAAAVVTFLIGERLDSSVILAVVVIIVLIGYIQEGRAERALDAVQGMLPTSAVVIRGGRRQETSAEELVPGDVVIVNAGDRIPADLRLVRSRNLNIEEAALTGESVPVEKAPDPVDENVEIGDRTSLAFSGTLATAGQGVGIVVSIGDRTQIGRISRMLTEIEQIQTPLARRLDIFTKWLSIVIISLAVITFFVGVLVWGEDSGEMFLAAVSIAVAAIPEGLPAVMTVTLAIGVERMARRKAIIRRMAAVETLGSITIICSDKTGTLTRNEMTATVIRPPDLEISVEGVGYEPVGDFLIDETNCDIADYPNANEMVRAGLLCNDATLELEGGAWTPYGDPTEAALLVLGMKAGYEREQVDNDYPRLDAIPFSSERRYMATLHRYQQGQQVVYAKGAPERLLEMCSSEQHGDEVRSLDRDLWRDRVTEIAGRGQRLLAIARKDVDADTNELRDEDVESDLVLLGMFGLIDPPRDEAIRSVEACLGAGIKVKMATGDHAATAKAIARDLGIANTDDVVIGRDVETMSDEELQQSALSVDVFARVSPEHKLRLVQAFQAGYAVTAMTGDGVNDAPALKRADVGIAMGMKGTEAAREASDMVLADDNFATIERAIAQGRSVYDNLQKAILFMLPTNAAQTAVIVTAVAFGAVLPVTPVQILWINMVTAVTLGITFAWEHAEGDVMKRPPRRTDEPLLTPFMLWRIGFVGLLLLLGTRYLFSAEQGDGATTLEFARTVAVNALVMGQIFYLISVRFFNKPSYTWTGLTGSPAVLIAIAICVALQLLLTYAPFMQVLFGTQSLDASAWAGCIAVGFVIFVLVEVEKFVRRSYFSRESQA